MTSNVTTMCGQGASDTSTNDARYKDVQRLEGFLYKLFTVLLDVEQVLRGILRDDEHDNRSHRLVNECRDRLAGASTGLTFAANALKRAESLYGGDEYVCTELARHAVHIDLVWELHATRKERGRAATEHINLCIQRRVLGWSSTQE